MHRQHGFSTIAADDEMSSLSAFERAAMTGEKAFGRWS